MGLMNIDDMVNKIFCEDALSLMARIPDASIDLVLTDPPYNMLSGKAKAWDTPLDLQSFWEQAERIITPSGVIAITAAMPFAALLVTSNIKLFRYEWVLVKNIATDFLNANHRPLRTHENVYIFSKGKSTAGNNGGENFMNYYPQFEKGVAYNHHHEGKYEGYSNTTERIPTKSDGKRYPKTVLYSAMLNDKKQHPTQKSVKLFEYLIRTYTLPGKLVIDPYCGSGTTALAARNTERQWIVGDISEKYCKLAQKRLEDMFASFEKSSKL